MTTKRWIALLLFAGLFIVFMIVNSAQTLNEETIAQRGWSEQVYERGGLDKLVLLELDGVLVNQSAGLFSATYNHQQFLAQIEHAFADTSVDGIVLKVNSPGGGVIESDEIYQLIRELREKHAKPFVVYMSNTAASGGYYISAGADQIYAHPATMTGSIGTIISYLNFYELAEEWGVREETYASGLHKGMLSSLKEPSAEERQIIQSIVDEAHVQFVDVIVEGRGMSRSEVESLADGRVYSGLQAREVGLIDETGLLDDAIAATADLAGITKPTVVQYKTSSWALWDQLLLAMGRLGSHDTHRSVESFITPPALMYLMPW